MRKVILVVLSLTAVIMLQAQQTPAADSLKEYTGKYKFPDGSAVPEVTVTIQNGALFASSPMGSSDLKRIEKDIFEVVAYSGTATFKRNDQAKISGVKIEVEDMILDGTKTEDGIYFPDRYKLLRSER